MYLDYFDYKKDFGGSLDEASFNRLEHKARALIDLLTHGRVRDENPVRDAVKYACFDLIQAMSGTEAAGGGPDMAVQSMSNDGVTVTFAGAQSPSARYGAIIRTYLAAETTAFGVPLMYAGVDA